jgi:hypothetical protein
MTIDAQSLRLHAAGVSEERLSRVRGRLQALTPAQRLAVEETAFAVAQATAGCLLERAAADEALAAVLARLYPSAGNGTARG